MRSSTAPRGWNIPQWLGLFVEFRFREKSGMVSGMELTPGLKKFRDSQRGCSCGALQALVKNLRDL